MVSLLLPVNPRRSATTHTANRKPNTKQQIRTRVYLVLLPQFKRECGFTRAGEADCQRFQKLTTHSLALHTKHRYAQSYVLELRWWHSWCSDCPFIRERVWPRFPQGDCRGTITHRHDPGNACHVPTPDEPGSLSALGHDVGRSWLCPSHITHFPCLHILIAWSRVVFSRPGINCEYLCMPRFAPYSVHVRSSLIALKRLPGEGGLWVRDVLRCAW
jgi:hypothetical protein